MEVKPPREVTGAEVGRVIFEGDTPNLRRLKFRVLPDCHTTVGRVLGVVGRRPGGAAILTLIRVDQVREHNPHEDAQSSTVADVIPFETRYAPEGQSTVIYRVADAELLEEAIYSDAGELVRISSVETLPLSGSPVVDVPPDLIARAHNLADDPDRGLDLGHLYGLPEVKALLHRNVVQTHVFIAGGIGRGKSYARAVLAEELAAHGVPQINIDPMGEMVAATEDLGGRNVVPGKAFTLPLSALESRDIIEAIPGINPATNIAVLIEYAHNYLLQQRVIGRGEHFGVDDLLKCINDVAPNLDMEKKNTLYPAVQRASSLRYIDFIGDPFPWETELQPGRLVNIDCRGRRVPELRLIAASVARDVQRLARARKIPFVVFSIDEAHLIAPNDDHVVTTQVLREIARIGRHYRIGLILTTQSPADLDRPILKRLLTRLIFAIEPDQLESLRGVFSDAPEGIIRALPKLPIGACLVTGVSETVKHAMLVNVRNRFTTAGGTTPDIFADLAKRGWPKRRDFGDVIRKDKTKE
jgi:DNA helicase HerA-like ATPase